MASAKAMLSLLPRGGRSGFGSSSSSNSISQCLTLKRSYSILATRSSNCLAYNTNNRQSCNGDVSCHHHHQHAVHQINRLENATNNTQSNGLNKRYFSKYASVDHSTAYREAMDSSHGVQLQLALEEGRGKDDAPFDPFSQFLDQMGDSSEVMEDGDYDEKEYDGVEDAEYEEVDDDEEDEDDEDYGEDEEEDNASLDEGGRIYTTTGAVRRPKSEKLALRAGYPAGGNFAVISLAGFQHKVAVDDLLVVNKLKPVSEWSVGSTHTLRGEDVLLIANQNKTLVGLPGVAGAEVDVMVEEITRDKTLVIFKKRRRKHSRRKNGFRRQVTFLRVLDVRMPKGEEDEVGKRGGGVEGMEEEEVRVAA